MKKIRILIVDDHILLGGGLKAILDSEQDFEVVALAGSVQQAVTQALALKPDIVLMDFELPDGSGMDAAKTILAENPQCKIVFLTLSESEADLFAAVRSGARGFISKSVSAPWLVAAVRNVKDGEAALWPVMKMPVMDDLSRKGPVEAQLAPRLSKLTAREKEVFYELATGKTNQEIAERLILAENTVKYHVHSILTKLSLINRKSVKEIASDYGFIRDDAGVIDARNKCSITDLC